MMGFLDLAERWEREAGQAERYGDERGATIARLHAAELREAIRSHAAELLTPSEAEDVSGFAKRTLREMVAEGRLGNHGRKGSPRYRRADLPTKPRTADTFDASAAARGMVARAEDETFNSRLPIPTEAPL